MGSTLLAMNRYAFIPLIGMLTCASVASAESLAVAIIDEVLPVSFEPVTVELLRETGLGSIEQVEADYVPLSRAASATSLGTAIIAGAFFKGESVSDDYLASHSFVAKGASGERTSSPVETWDFATLNDNSVSKRAYDQRIESLREQQASLREEVGDLRVELQSLRLDASKVAGIDEIVDVKLELSKLERADSRRQNEKARLKDLVARAQELEEPEDINRRRRELAVDLREAARITANADRLRRRREESAKLQLEESVELIEQSESVDLAALGTELLRLREKRKELEAQFGLVNTPQSIADF